MATVKFQGAPVKTVGELPAAGAVAPDFSLAAQDLSDFDLDSLKGKRVVQIFSRASIRMYVQRRLENSMSRCQIFPRQWWYVCLPIFLSPPSVSARPMASRTL